MPTLIRKCTLWTWPACLFGSATADFTRQKYLERMTARDRETPVGYDFGHSVNTFTVTSCKKPGAWKRSSLETVKHINCWNQLRWITSAPLIFVQANHQLLIALSLLERESPLNGLSVQPRCYLKFLISLNAVQRDVGVKKQTWLECLQMAFHHQNTKASFSKLLFILKPQQRFHRLI